MKGTLSLSLLTVVVAGLAGCGGSALTKSGSAPVAATLTAFGDNAGVARATTTSIETGQSLTVVMMAPNIQSGVNNINNNGNSPAAVDLSNVYYSHSNAYGRFHAGTATINGTTVNVIAYSDFSDKVSVVYAADASSNILMAGGVSATNIPAGSYTYNGTNVIGNRDGSYYEEGTFNMAVNFNSGTAAISGSTTNSTFGGSGISINTATGNFSDASITISTNGEASVAGSIYGQFNGNGATGVTGIYHENASTPIIAGAFAGKR